MQAMALVAFLRLKSLGTGLWLFFEESHRLKARLGGPPAVFPLQLPLRDYGLNVTLRPRTPGVTGVIPFPAEIAVNIAAQDATLQQQPPPGSVVEAFWAF